jgi:hypothetical protein
MSGQVSPDRAFFNRNSFARAKPPMPALELITQDHVIPGRSHLVENVKAPG